MSKRSLQKTLNAIAAKFEGNNPKLVLREGTADKMGQELVLEPLDIYTAITSQLLKKGVKVKQTDVMPMIYDFLEDVYSNFRTKKNYTFEVIGTPRSFVLRVVQSGATGSVFKLALRQQLNPFLVKLETKVARLAGAPDEEFVRGIERVSPTGVASKTRGFLHLGHQEDSSIAKRGPALSIDVALKKSLKRNYSENLMLFLEKNSFFDNPGEFMKLSIESEAENSATTRKEEAGLLKALREELLKIDISDVKGSPSLKEEVVNKVIEAATGKKAPRVARSKVSKSVKTKRVVQQQKLGFLVNGQVAKSQNWASIIQAVNSRLPTVVQKNMGSPGLVNRTGAFASSARVSSYQETAQGFPSFGTTYDKTPYGVFDRTTGAAPWNSPQRDPQTLIQNSVKEILQSMAIGRFYLRRE